VLNFNEALHKCKVSVITLFMNITNVDIHRILGGPVTL